ncbi:MAG TPA: hypothetical protein PLZ01_09230, partial [bacterium]|nr:hypothetical protein [bacterium]
MSILVDKTTRVLVQGITGIARQALATYPTLAYDEANDVLYVGYTQFNENDGTWTTTDVDPWADGKLHFIGKGELYVAGSADGGASWGTPVNVTNTADFDERALVLAE